VPQRLAMSLASIFAAVALFLSMLGIYSLLAYVVAQRKRELGIRIALGSSAWRIFHLVLREGLVLVAGGLAVGVIGAAIVGRVLQSHLFGVSSHDPLVLSVVVVATGIIGTVACVYPARRATRVDPRSVLSDQ
jgi:ABC-type antimicrobial peptide transport system permease subunit